MLILIEIDNGEQWEDYHTWVHKIYDIPSNENIESLHKKYRQYIIDKMLEQNITINPHYFNIMNHSKCKDQKSIKKL